MAAAGFHDFVRELFAEMGPVQIRRMFGGAGVYADGVMFALLADGAIHLKTDRALRAELTEQGSGPFVGIPESGPRAGERIEMGYWRLPESALDDPAEASDWGRKALSVAKDAALAKRKPKRGAKRNKRA